MASYSSLLAMCCASETSSVRSWARKPSRGSGSCPGSSTCSAHTRQEGRCTCAYAQRMVHGGTYTRASEGAQTHSTTLLKLNRLPSGSHPAGKPSSSMHMHGRHRRTCALAARGGNDVWGMPAHA